MALQREENAPTFDPMFAGDPILELIPWAIGIAGFVVGFYWIHRITKDIEDN